MVTNPNVPSDTFVITKKQSKQGYDEESNNRSRSDSNYGDWHVSRTRKRVLQLTSTSIEIQHTLLVENHD